MYNDDLAMLPDEDVGIPKAQPRVFLADIRRDPIRWRATLYGWIACFCQASEFSTFGFYLPVLLLTVGVTADNLVGTNLALMGLYTFATISGWVGPLLTPRIGQRGISIAGFGIVFISLLVAAWAIYTGDKIIIPFAAAAMLWGHYWDASNVAAQPPLGADVWEAVRKVA